MAYTSCAAKIAASITPDCNKPLVGGYTGQAIIISADDFAKANVVTSASNPRKILGIDLPVDGSVMAYTIDNVFTTPFTGSTTAGSADDGRNGYTKTLAIRIPMRGADVAKDVVEPLVKSADGFVVIAAKKDRVGDGSFEVFGYLNSMRGDISTLTRDESANGGDWLVNLTTIERWAEVTLVGADNDYESAKAEFEKLLAFEPIVMRMHTSVENQEFFKLSANGVVHIDSVKNGVKVRKTLVSPNIEQVNIENDADTEIVVWGAVTRLVASDDANTGLTSLDVSKNTALTELNCGANTGITSLDVSKNTALTELRCYDCNLTSLDISKNTALTYLDYSGCTGLTSVDASKNTELTNLGCEYCTGLTSLDVSKNTALTYLHCNSCTGLTSLDVSKNVALTYLSCNDCSQIGMLNISNLTECTTFNGMPNSDVLSTILVTGSPNAAIQSVMEQWFDSADTTATGKLYVDENTQQSLIDAATDKGWEIIY